jgi:triacylglycerol lipase
MADPIAPLHAAKIASKVYNIKSVGISRALLADAEGLGLSGPGFKHRPDERFTGRPGLTKLMGRYGFGYVSPGENNRVGEHIVALRGTSMKPDWVTNFQIATKKAKTGNKVHIGFQRLFEDFQPDIEAYFSDKWGTVHCVGHSLGGALATLTADYLRTVGRFDVKLYTFGAPRVGLNDFSRTLTQAIGHENIYRVFHSTDPVPMIAPYPFIHAPFTGMDRLNWGIKLDKPGGRINSAHHSMTEYITSVQGAADWAGVAPSTMESHIPWEMELKQYVGAKFQSIKQFGANILAFISRCIRGLLKMVGRVIGGALSASMSALDQLAWILYHGAMASIKVAGYLTSLIKIIFRFLGRSLQSGVNITADFLRWVFNLLYSSTANMASIAVSQLF